MTLLNEIYDKNSINKTEFKTFITLLCPFAPHICEELWQLAGFEGRHDIRALTDTMRTRRGCPKSRLPFRLWARYAAGL